jgi:hypothetical protein
MQLYTTAEIQQLQEDLPYLIEISQWLKTFVARPHPDVGRPGPVCPFVPKGLKLNYLRLKVIRSKNLNFLQIADLVLPYLNTFLELEPIEREAALNKAILLIFPDVSDNDAPGIIDTVHKWLKPFFVELGVMLGEFHNRTDSPGLHNLNFRPLRSPIPMLVVRPMTEADLPFLENPGDPYLRVKYLEAYIRNFENRTKDEKMLMKAREQLMLAKKELIENHNLVYG